MFHLPWELLEETMEFLSLGEWYVVRAVSRTWKAVAEGDVLCRKLLIRLFGPDFESKAASKKRRKPPRRAEGTSTLFGGDRHAPFTDATASLRRSSRDDDAKVAGADPSRESLGDSKGPSSSGKKKRKVLAPPPPLFRLLLERTKRFCRVCWQWEGTPFVPWKPERRVCQLCRVIDPRYQTATKTAALRDFKLQAEDLEDLERQVRQNPHRRSATMEIFRSKDLRREAIFKYGSLELWQKRLEDSVRRCAKLKASKEQKKALRREALQDALLERGLNLNEQEPECWRFLQGKSPRGTSARSVAESVHKEHLLATVLDADGRFRRFLHQEGGYDLCRASGVRISLAQDLFVDALWEAHSENRLDSFRFRV